MGIVVDEMLLHYISPERDVRLMHFRRNSLTLCMTCITMHKMIGTFVDHRICVLPKVIHISIVTLFYCYLITEIHYEDVLNAIFQTSTPFVSIVACKSGIIYYVYQRTEDLLTN